LGDNIEVGSIYKAVEKIPTTYVGKVLKVEEDYVTLKLDYPVLTIRGFSKIVKLNRSQFKFVPLSRKEGESC